MSPQTWDQFKQEHWYAVKSTAVWHQPDVQERLAAILDAALEIHDCLIPFGDYEGGDGWREGAEHVAPVSRYLADRLIDLCEAVNAFCDHPAVQSTCPPDERPAARADEPPPADRKPNWR
jgi:hypothetical protein